MIYKTHCSEKYSFSLQRPRYNATETKSCMCHASLVSASRCHPKLSGGSRGPASVQRSEATGSFHSLRRYKLVTACCSQLGFVCLCFYIEYLLASVLEIPYSFRKIIEAHISVSVCQSDRPKITAQQKHRPRLNSKHSSFFLGTA